MISALSSIRAQIYQVGDIYTFPDSSKGVICYVNPDNPVEGWAVALNDVGWVSKNNNKQYYMIDANVALPAGMETHPYDAEDGIGRSSLSSWVFEGKKNTKLLVESGHSDAAEAVGYYNGWYIPDAVQLRMIFSLLPIIQPSILAAGGDIESLKYMYTNNKSHGFDYWTSTRVGADQMLVVRGSQYFYQVRTPSNHNIPINTENSTQNRIRAVRDFGTDAISYWVDNYPYSEMVVSPDLGKTSYDAYVVFNRDTFVVTSSAIVNKTYDKDTSYWTTCASTIPYTYPLNPIFSSLDISKPGLKVFRDTLHTVHGCDSIITLVLTVNPIYEKTEVKKICESVLPYSWRGKEINAGGIYYDTLKTVCCNCDSVFGLNLIVSPLPDISYSPDNPSICQGFAIEINATTTDCKNYFFDPIYEGFDRVVGNDKDITSKLSTMTSLFASGNKVYAMGDSAVKIGTGTVYGSITTKSLDLSYDFTLELRLMGWQRKDNATPAATRLRISVDNNEADTLTIPGSNDVNPGHYDVYSVNFHAATLTSYITISAIQEIAPGSPYAEERVYIDYVRITDNSSCDVYWYEGANPIGEGETIKLKPKKTTEYYVEVVGAGGCVRKDTVEVVVHEPSEGDTIVSTCVPFTWHGKTYTETPIDAPKYTIPGGNQYGCDSTVVLKLTISDKIEVNTEMVVCDSLVWINGEVLKHSGGYQYKTVTVAGCDSIVNLKLTVNNSCNITVDSAICANNLPFTWNDSVFHAAGEKTTILKTIHNCDSVVTMRLTLKDTLKVTNTTGKDTTYCKDMLASTLSVTAEGGDGSFSYQWYGNGKAIAGATHSTYTPSTATANSDSTFSVKVTGKCTSDSIGIARVKTYGAVVVSSTSTDANYCKNETPVTSLEVNITGGHGTPTYQWYKNGAIIIGETSDAYTPSSSVVGVYDYSVKVSNECAGDSIHVAMVKVYP
ncbi:MAG: hypothetical protein J6X01_04680, partial [Bacteroidales bacterium]|nr:hypothetical protein [Bacteroidales bacterium]